MDKELQAKITELKRLAARFHPSMTENMLLECFASGNWVNCSPDDECDDKSYDPNQAADWDQDERQIQAVLLAWLCTDKKTQKLANPHGIQIYAADITGRLELSFADIPFPLALEHCRLKEGVELSRAEVSLLDFDGSLVHGILAEDMIVKHDVFMRNGFTASGEVRLLGAQIGRDLDCTAGTFNNVGGVALNADGIDVKSSIFLTEGFTANGSVRLVGAQIGGVVDCDAGTFTNTVGKALECDGINVKGSVFLRSGKNTKGEQTRFNAKGGVSLMLAQINGQLDCRGGDFSNPNGDALSLKRCVIKSSVSLSDGFSAEGRVDLTGAKIDGDLNCTNGNFQKTHFDLRDVSAGTLIDSGLNDIGNVQSPTVWPQQGNLLLDGFVYGRILSEGRLNADRRIQNWLMLQPQSPFRPQPYLQLAKVLTEYGDDIGAKHVLIEMEDRLHKDDLWSPLERPLLRWSIGYGYDPIRAFWWAAMLSGVGWIIYRRSYLAGGMVPTDKDASAEFRKPERRLPPYYPSFSPLIYSVENSLPLVKLGQEDNWEPDPEPDHPNVDQFAPRLGPRGIWEWLEKKKCGSNDSSSQTVPATPVNSAGSTGVISGDGTAATAPALEPEQKPSPRPHKFSQLVRSVIFPLHHLLVAVGLKPSETMGQPSFSQRFGTSPRFVRWFLWIQILLGWLLATLFVAGISGVVRKQ